MWPISLPNILAVKGNPNCFPPSKRAISSSHDPQNPLPGQNPRTTTVRSGGHRNRGLWNDRWPHLFHRPNVGLRLRIAMPFFGIRMPVTRPIPMHSITVMMLHRPTLLNPRAVGNRHPNRFRALPHRFSLTKRRHMSFAGKTNIPIRQRALGALRLLRHTWGRVQPTMSDICQMIVHGCTRHETTTAK